MNHATLNPNKICNNKTIAIAYRLESIGYDVNNERERNHYDSVCDLKSEYMLAVSDLIINKRIK